MKITVERAQLLKSLSHVHRVVERRNTIPILGNVLVRAENARLTMDSLSYRFPYSPGTGWTSFTVPFAASAGWRWNWNRSATQDQMRSVLENPTSLEIRGEYHTGPDEGALGTPGMQQDLGTPVAARRERHRHHRRPDWLEAVGINLVDRDSHGSHAVLRAVWPPNAKS